MLSKIPDSDVVWAPVFHLHQPTYDEGTRKYYFQCVYSSYMPHLDAIERHPNVKVNLNISGVLLEQMKKYNPEMIDRIRDGIERGQIYLTATPYSHAIMPLMADRYGDDALRLQIEKDLQLKRKWFGVEPRTFRPAEYAVNEDVVRVASEYFDYMLISGVTFGKANLDGSRAVQKGRIKLICRDDGLSNLLAGM